MEKFTVTVKLIVTEMSAGEAETLVKDVLNYSDSEDIFVVDICAVDYK